MNSKNNYFKNRNPNPQYGSIFFLLFISACSGGSFARFQIDLSSLNKLGGGSGATAPSPSPVPLFQLSTLNFSAPLTYSTSILSLNPLSIQQGGTGGTSLMNNALIYYDNTSSSLSGVIGGTTGQLITSNCPLPAPSPCTVGPTFQAAPAAPRWVFVTKSANFTIPASANGTVYLWSAPSAAAIAQLPAVSTVPSGFQIMIKKSDNTANAITVTPAGSDLIEGAATFSLPTQYNSVWLVADGSSSWIVTNR